jgi:hypothetical protein
MIICNIELGILHHSIIIVNKEENAVIMRTEVVFSEIPQTIIELAEQFDIDTIHIIGVTQIKEEIIEKITHLSREKEFIFS